MVNSKGLGNHKLNKHVQVLKFKKEAYNNLKWNIKTTNNVIKNE